MARGEHGQGATTMLMLDANLLIYAYHAQQPQHPRARAWLEETFAGSEPIGLPWQTLLAFLRITTHARIFERPLSMARAQQIVAMRKVPATVPSLRHSSLPSLAVKRKKNSLPAKLVYSVADDVSGNSSAVPAAVPFDL